MKRWAYMAENWIGNLKKEYPILFSVVVFLLALVITNVISVFVTLRITHDSKRETNPISLHFEDYPGSPGKPSGLYVENSKTESVFMDSVTFSINDKIVKITDDSSWSKTISSIGVNDEQKSKLKHPYDFSKPPLKIPNWNGIPLIAFLTDDYHINTIKGIKEAAIKFHPIVYCHDSDGKRFNSDSQ